MASHAPRRIRIALSGARRRRRGAPPPHAVCQSCASWASVGRPGASSIRLFMRRRDVIGQYVKGDDSNRMRGDGLTWNDIDPNGIVRREIPNTRKQETQGGRDASPRRLSHGARDWSARRSNGYRAAGHLPPDSPATDRSAAPAIFRLNAGQAGIPDSRIGRSCCCLYRGRPGRCYDRRMHGAVNARRATEQRALPARSRRHLKARRQEPGRL
jgi:hypothetical protein